MPHLCLIDPEGACRTIDAPVGESVMRIALDAAVDGMVGECGGGLACATCHCYVDDAWIDRLDTPSEAERDMLEITASERRPGSRLGCQILMSAEHDGLTVRLPATQY